MKNFRRQLLRLAALALPLLAACGDDNGPAGPGGNAVVENAFPLALGDRWTYLLEQSVFIIDGEALPDSTRISANGLQTVEATRTEVAGGEEAIGLRYDHIMGQLFLTGADTTVEIHYLARRGDKVLLKAIEGVYGTGGFIPFSLEGQSARDRLWTRVRIDGQERFITLHQLARRLLVGPSPILASGTALSSDGLQNRDDVFFYEWDYVYSQQRLYQGLGWTSAEAAGAGGMEVKHQVTAILPSLSGYEGPIAEVRETNSLIEQTGSVQTVYRYYYKGGVGMIQAEYFEPDIDVYGPDSLGIFSYYGTGTWEVKKRLLDHQLSGVR